MDSRQGSRGLPQREASLFCRGLLEWYQETYKLLKGFNVYHVTIIIYFFRLRVLNRKILTEALKNKEL